MKQNDEIKLLTERQMAEALGVSIRTARRLRKRRLIPFYKLGSLIRYDQRECALALGQYRVKAIGEHREDSSK